jgi:hypothetical protein
MQLLCYGQSTILANRTNGSKGWGIGSCTRGNCVCHDLVVTTYTMNQSWDRMILVNALIMSIGWTLVREAEMKQVVDGIEIPNPFDAECVN